MQTEIHDVDALEAQLGAKPKAIDLKVIDHLDGEALKWLAASRLAFVGFSDARRIDATLAGGSAGFARAMDPRRLHMPLDGLDHPAEARPGRGVGMLFLVGGLDETLRINGRVANVDAQGVEIEVQECYAHCGKALMRSAFWHPTVAPGATLRVPDFLAACRFMVLITANHSLHTDASPKGDPAGLLVQSDADDIRFADRPGNRKTDSFRNLLERPDAAALLIAPSLPFIARIQGRAVLNTESTLREAFAVNGKVPKLVTRLELAAPIVLEESPVLVRAAPWTTTASPPPGIDPAATFAAHVKLNRQKGLHAAFVGALVSIPGAMRKGLEADYRRKMY